MTIDEVIRELLDHVTLGCKLDGQPRNKFDQCLMIAISCLRDKADSLKLIELEKSLSK